MKKYYSVATLLALSFFAVIGCDKTNQNADTSLFNTNSMTDARSAMPGTNALYDTNSRASNSPNPAGREVDNSAINQRDRNTNNLTPGDQGNTQSDIDLTQKIRKALVMDSTYSMTAKNIKIITTDGRVTLRGPVNSDSEKSGVETLTKNIAGDGNVDNQLEVKSNP